ncbi:MAG: PIG-L family deacetylase [Candidatus Eremiobacteraeota bacterium]|nr:PIG-L family deacetylase [Candidatus Eremiobacteraeota bacterium]MCW5867993.1 PIG-L family deacetylase [Candidatus Eremiobacteraeota bacterium]
MKTALVIGAHPDDPEFGVGGTVAAWGEKGWEFHYLIVTDGSKGTPDATQDPCLLIQTRQQEQQKAAQMLGVKSVEFLGLPDGEVQADQNLLEKLVAILRKRKPYAVFTHNPEALEYRRPGSRPQIAHRDHRAVGQCVLDAVYPVARDPHYFPAHHAAGLTAHKVREVYLWGSPQANVRVDIRHTLNRKLDAIVQHQSQIAADHPRILKSRQSGRPAHEYFLRLRISP